MNFSAQVQVERKHGGRDQRGVLPGVRGAAGPSLRHLPVHGDHHQRTLMDNHHRQDEFHFSLSGHLLTHSPHSQYFIIHAISFITEPGFNEETQHRSPPQTHSRM